MRYLSVCSGIEAATQAWHPLGWQPVAFSEIEPFPSAVLAHHYPSVPNLGDMTKFKEWPNEPVDLLCGGTPCQSFSVAGLRKGLADPRGNLMLTYLAIAARYQPRWIVWENVPGVLSSNGGRDFGSFLGGLGQLGYGFAYRVLDAQHVRTRRFPWAVPQRRRRVFVVGYLGDWRRAAAVLFDRESLSGDPAPRREAGQGAAGCIAQGVALRGRDGGATAELTGAVSAALRCAGGGGDKAHALIPSVSPTLRAGGNKTGGDRPPGTDVDTCDSLIPVAIQERAVCENPNAGPDGAGFRQDGTSYTLEARTVSQAVAFDLVQITSKTNRSIPQPVSPTMAKESQLHAFNDWAVRRLTPIECERLQGFPDDFTRIPYRNKPADLCPDGPRYKALGNSMAVNCMEWLGERIALVDSMEAAA